MKIKAKLSPNRQPRQINKISASGKRQIENERAVKIKTFTERDNVLEKNAEEDATKPV